MAKKMRKKPRKGPNLLGHVTAPRYYDPPGPAPRETLAYLSPFEKRALLGMTDGRASRGPRGLPSFADDSASSMGVSRGDASQGTYGGGAGLGGMGAGASPPGGPPSGGGGGSSSSGDRSSAGYDGGVMGARGGTSAAPPGGPPTGPAYGGMGKKAAPPGGPPSGPSSPFSGGFAKETDLDRMRAAREALQGTFGVQPGLSSPALPGLGISPADRAKLAGPGSSYGSVTPRSPSSTAAADADLAAQKAAQAAVATQPSAFSGAFPSDPRLDVPLGGIFGPGEQVLSGFNFNGKTIDIGTDPEQDIKDALLDVPYSGFPFGGFMANATPNIASTAFPGKTITDRVPATSSVPSGPPLGGWQSPPSISGPAMPAYDGPFTPDPLQGTSLPSIPATPPIGVLRGGFVGDYSPSQPPASPDSGWSAPSEADIDFGGLFDNLNKLNTFGRMNYDRVQRAMGNRDPNGAYGGVGGGGGGQGLMDYTQQQQTTSPSNAVVNSSDMLYLFSALQAAGATPEELAAVLAMMKSNG